MDSLIRIALVGIGATAFVDLWSLLRRRWLGIPVPAFGMVGRWMLGLPTGRFVRSRLASDPPAPAEHLVGWSAHYAIGVAFASLLPLAFGERWLRQPTLLPALLVGIATVLAPFLLMHPGMGLGLAARRAPHPGKARFHSVLTHSVFGLGLYLSAALVAAALR